MAARTCKPDSDLKQIWQRLIPGVAYPACTSQDDDPRENTNAGKSNDNPGPSGKSAPNSK
jgi:hypothetical protein